MSFNNPDDLKCAIEAAFTNMATPEINQMAEWNDWDKECIDRDFLGLLNRKFKSDDILPLHAKSLPALTPKAFVFFLKDYLNYSIDNPFSELAEHLIYRFNEIDPSDEYWRLRLDLITNDILSIIIDCLSFIRDRLPEESEYLIDSAKKSIASLSNIKQVTCKN